jgi:hypothetical protein
MVATNSAFDAPAPSARQRVVAALLVVLAPAVHAGMLYKSIGPDGVVQFSDTLPANGTIVERRPTGEAIPAPAMGMSASSGLGSNPLLALGDGSADDEALARANAQVDLAEHALALARRDLDADPARMHLATSDRTRADDDRIAFFEHDLKIARANLIEMLKSRRAATVLAAAAAGAPVLGPLHKLASR